MLKTAPTEAEVSKKTIATIATVMQSRGLDTGLISDEAKLTDTLGLKSMDLAEIVLTLEDELDVDPFGVIPITSIRTVADLVRAYLFGLGLADPESASIAANGAAAPAARARRVGRRR